MNKNQELRDTILKDYFDENEYVGGTRRFSGVPLKIMETLIDNGFVDLNERQNDSPDIREMIEFSRENNEGSFYVDFDGYVVSNERDDYRLSIDTLTGSINASDDNLEALEMFKKSSDEFEILPIEDLRIFSVRWD